MQSSSKWQWLFLAGFILLVMTSVAFGSDTDTGLQWEAPFRRFRASITGPIAFGMSCIGLVIAGLVLIYGGEINEFIRRFIFILFVISVLMFANNILSFLFAGGASVFPAPMPPVGEGSLAGASAPALSCSASGPFFATAGRF